MVTIRQTFLFVVCTLFFSSPNLYFNDIGDCYTREEVSEIALTDLVDGNNTLGCNLYKRLNTNANDNLFFSPHSISSALSMAYIGAVNQTKDEMQAVLFENRSQRFFSSGIQQLRTQFNTDNSPVSIANKIFIEKTFEAKKSFQQTLKEDFGAPFEAIDTSDPTGAAVVINSWVSKETREKIQDIVTKEDIKPNQTKLALVNAIYFKADWKKPFSKANTSKAPFLTTSGEFLSVDMMDQTTQVNYMENDMLQAIELPYKDCDLSMVVILPNQRERLTDVERSLSREKITEWTTLMRKHKVTIRMPKFKLETTYKNLKDSFCAMGMPRAFSDDAEFFGISDTPLKISKIIHKAFVEVEETGTEAAAATVVIMNRCLASLKTPSLEKIFNADHPFIFIIRDKMTGLNLFMGRVERP